MPGGSAPITNVANGGTVQIDGAGAADANVALQIAGGSTVDLQAGSSLTAGGALGTFLGNTSSKGTLLLSGSTNYTGNIAMQGGAVTSNVTGTLNGDIILLNDYGFGNLVSAAAGKTLTLAGTISSFAADTPIIIGGPGTVAFTGTNTYTGITTINSGGTLQLGAGGATGTAGPVGIVDNGTLAIAHSNAFSLTNDVSGTGGLTLAAANTGTVTLAGTNTYTGATTLTGGTLSIASDAPLGLSSSLVFNGGTLNVTAAAITTRAITVNSAGGTITNTAPQIYHIEGVVSGAGNLTVSSGSFVSFEGINTLTGTVTTAAGSAAFLTGTGSLATANVVDNGSFDITGITPTSATIASLSGSGGVVLGAKSLIIANGTGIYSGAMTGTGPITVTGGQLSMNGTTGSVVTIANGGTLKGIGTVGGFVASSGGTVAPGNSIGTLNVAGNTTFASGSIYQVEVDAAGNSDKIAATGTATIASGATVNVVAAAGTYATNTSYTILTAAGGVTGNFGSATSNFVFLTPTTTNTGNSVVLTLVNNTVVAPTPAPVVAPAPALVVVTFPSVAVTPNQIASSTALQALGSGSLYNAVLVSTSVSNALAAFDASSGEIHATLLASQFEAANNQRRTVLERMRRQTRDEGWSVWGSVGGDWGNLGANGNAASANRNGVDVSIGADGSLDDHWRGGIEGGYNGGNINIADRASHAHLSGGHVGAYAWGNYGNYVLRTGFSWGFGTAHTARAISFAGFSDAATASENTKTVLLYGEAGYDIRLQDVTLEPYMGLAWTQLNAGSFRETGGSAALSGASKDMDNGYVSFGLNANTRAYSLGGTTTIAPLARIAWQHGFNTITASRSLSFIAGGPSFTVLGTPLDGDRALLDIGATLSVSANTEFSLGYYGSLGGRANDHAVKLLGTMHL